MKTRLAGRLFLAGLVLILTVPAAAKVTFAGLDLSEDNRLLFRADSALDGAAVQNALFVSRLTDLQLQQLTAFPEKMELLANGRVLQVRNAFGALRIPLSGGLPRQVPGFPCFSSGSPASGGRVEDMAASADGRWLLYVEPETSAYGNLILLDTQLGEKKTVARNVERPDRFFPACWSPDSRVFVYARAGKLYYYTAGSSQTPPVDERYRLIGEGAINSVSWAYSGDFFYIRGSTVFRVRGSELFARAIYADFLEIGAVAGKIPFDFDSNFDSFWIAPDARSVLFAKGGRNIFYYPLEMDDFSVSDAALPYVMLPQSCYRIQVLWPPSGPLTLLASVLRKEGRATFLYRLKKDAGNRMVFTLLEEPAGPNAALSPDGAQALCWGDKGIVLYDYANWRIRQTLSPDPAVSCLWINNGEFIIGDGRRIERRSLTGSGSLICLAGVDEYGFEEESGRILARAGDAWFVTGGTDPWTAFSAPALRPPSQVSGRYRVYLEPQSAGPYANLPMIRNTASVGTASLLPPAQYKREDPARESAAAGDLFTHGLRTGLREVALCFDLYDDLTGLPFVLDALNNFGFKATFYLNGEFIRRYPQAAGIISETGHEAASMFFAPIDLSDSRYRIGEDFIARGLARNEDEFYQASGRELSLLWHPPYYAASAEIVSAASKAGYRSSGRDVDPMDWLSQEDAYRLGLSQISAGDMIDRIIDQKRPGSIIPIRLGALPGDRLDYLYLRINVLLDALVREGYRIVPVSALMEHAR
ncbi:MAG: polysaccharide deacetylase family protein [Treponema sp.]|jgi:peptidoglycan/xylan/chitin deacetylase (PgdA/CDA1 family)|nr:polysaccharide deacetylase family protein [Treponema sp.]